MSLIWAQVIVAVLTVSAISLVGVVTLGLKEKFIKSILFYLISFSAGALLGDVFLHLLPEMSEIGFGVREGIYFLLGLIFFFVLERFILWQHTHGEHDEKVHSSVYLSMIGDSLHNFIDGIIIAASFLVDYRLGLATTFAVILHEIPQEIGQYAVLLHGGWSKSKALLYNFLSALAAVAGAIIVLAFTSSLTEPPASLLAFAGASFVYVALSDLVPQLHKEQSKVKSLFQFIWFLLGAGIMGLLLLVE